MGPFVQLGPLRNSEVANFVGFVSTISLIIILTTCLLIYGFVTFSKNDNNEKSSINFLTPRVGINLLLDLLLVVLGEQVLLMLY